MSERFRIAVIGTGQIAGLNATRDDKPPLVTHAQAFTHEGSFDLVALHDTDKERALLFLSIGVARSMVNYRRFWKMPDPMSSWLLFLTSHTSQLLRPY